MKPYYVFQLSQEEQDRLREKIRFVLLYEFENDPAKVLEYYGAGIDELVQNGMDSKVDDLYEIHRLYDEIMHSAIEEPEDEWER